MKELKQLLKDAEKLAKKLQFESPESLLTIIGTKEESGIVYGGENKDLGMVLLTIMLNNEGFAGLVKNTVFNYYREKPEERLKAVQIIMAMNLTDNVNQDEKEESKKNGDKTPKKDSENN